MTQSEIEVDLAKPKARIIAVLINNILYSLLLLSSVFLFSLSEQLAHPWDTIIYLLIALSYLIYAGLQLFWMGCDGQSIGKKIMGLKVIRNNGETAGWLHNILIRELLYSVIVCLLGGLMYGVFKNEDAISLPYAIASLVSFFMLFKSNRRTLQDLLAKTAVIQLPK